MVNILKDLGYNNLRTLTTVIEGAEYLQDAVMESFGEDTEYKELSDEQKSVGKAP